MPTTAQTNLLSWVCKYFSESSKCLNLAICTGEPTQKLRDNMSLVYMFRKQVKESEGIVTALELQNMYNRIQCFIELLVDSDLSNYNLENSEADCSCDHPDSGGCCKPVLFTMNGVSERVLLYSEWETYGDIPGLSVIVKINGRYQKVDVDPVFDKMPNPSEITITLDAVPMEDGNPTDWFIWVGP